MPSTKEMKNAVPEIAAGIARLNPQYKAEAQRRWDRLTKPQGSLGQLEDIVCQLVAIREELRPSIQKKMVFVFAGDHGVAAEGVSAYPPEVTSQMVHNFLRGGAAINVLSNHAGAVVNVIDIGVNQDFKSLSGLIDKKVRFGTRNFLEGPALTEEETIAAVQTGLDLAKDASARGVDLIATGEMGIGNTTASSAIAAVLMNCDVESVTGSGTGLTSAGKKHKIDVIKRAIEVNGKRLTDPMSILSALGGLEIAGLCGLIIGGAVHRTPVIVDGFISSVAALIAVELNPAILDYLIFAHKSEEPGHHRLLKYLRVRPILNLEMRLGEGSGAALAMTILEAAVKLYSEMATFDEAQVSGKAS